MADVVVTISKEEKDFLDNFKSTVSNALIILDASIDTAKDKLKNIYGSEFGTKLFDAAKFIKFQSLDFILKYDKNKPVDENVANFAKLLAALAVEPCPRQWLAKFHG